MSDKQIPPAALNLVSANRHRFDTSLPFPVRLLVRGAFFRVQVMKNPRDTDSTIVDAIEFAITLLGILRRRTRPRGRLVMD